MFEKFMLIIQNLTMFMLCIINFIVLQRTKIGEVFEGKILPTLLVQTKKIFVNTYVPYFLLKQIHSGFEWLKRCHSYSHC